MTMTRDEALEIIAAYKQVVLANSLEISLASLAFGLAGPDIEKALGLEGVLYKQLPAKEMTQVFSNYLTVLQNAIDGKLVVVEDEWKEIIGDD